MLRTRWLLTLPSLLAFLTPLSSGRSWAEPLEREIQVEGATRSYLIHVPSAWDRARPVALLFVFHGAGSDAESMVRATGFDALAEQEPTLVVYPRAPQRTRRYDVEPPAGRTSADVRFVDLLLLRLKERFPVDPRRVYATGFSNGAALCYRLAAERPAVFAAIAPVAGYLPGGLSAGPAVPVPLLHVHGTRDGRVPPPAATGDPSGPIATWARWNGCTRGPEVSTLGGTSPLVLRRVALAGATPRSDTVLVLAEGQDHAWAGGPGGPVTRLVWDFLRAHPQPASAVGALPAR